MEENKTFKVQKLTCAKTHVLSFNRIKLQYIDREKSQMPIKRDSCYSSSTEHDIFKLCSVSTEFADTTKLHNQRKDGKCRYMTHLPY
jgi:hypothetical protein